MIAHAPSLTRAQLQDLTQELVVGLARVSRRIELMHDDSGDEPGMDADQQRSLVAQRSVFERALSRMADGAYGSCESCEVAIPYGRLLLQPEELLCTECAARQ